MNDMGKLCEVFTIDAEHLVLLWEKLSLILLKAALSYSKNVDRHGISKNVTVFYCEVKV